MPSLSSASSSESSSSPVQTRKRKRKQIEVESSESSEGPDTSDASSSADEEDSDAPQHLPPTDDTVLSHAERRRQKKKQKRDHLTAARELDDRTGASPPSNVHSKAKAEADVSADDPRRQKRQNSIWVGNLSFRTTQDALQGFFDGAGTTTRVHMPMRRGKQVQGENMGCVLSSPHFLLIFSVSFFSFGKLFRLLGNVYIIWMAL